MKKLVLAMIFALPVLTQAQMIRVVEEHVAAHVSKEIAADATARMACKSRDPAVDRHACMREMMAVRNDKSIQAANVAAQSALDANKIKRCDVFGEDDTKREKARCLARLREGQTTGSVEKGGTITEHREIEVTPVK